MLRKRALIVAFLTGITFPLDTNVDYKSSTKNKYKSHIYCWKVLDLNHSNIVRSGGDMR